jgi:putative tryptophan/tyrosine transport system substrate-binding protein
VLAVTSAPSTDPALKAAEAAAQRIGVQILSVPVRTRDEFDGAFAMMIRDKVDGFLAVASPLIRSQRVLLTELSLKHRLPGVFGPREHVEAGSLMSYSADLVDLTRRSATYIDKILKGARPADLPVEQASRYEFVINLKAARALGVKIPPAVLARADEILE